MTDKPRRKGGQKHRAEFRKGYEQRKRETDITRQYQTDRLSEEELLPVERIATRGEHTRKRVVIGTPSPTDAALPVQLEVDTSGCLRGRVLSVHGLTSDVLGEDGRRYQCAVRRLLKTLATDQLNILAAGDEVLFRPEAPLTGVIERVEPRRTVVCRENKGHRQVLVANVDQLIIVTSVAEPEMKPNLIDRLLVTAERFELKPILCINKIDLCDPAQLQPFVGVYAQLGYLVLQVSALTGFGLDRLRRVLTGQASAVAGQSGVGKSSLLNALEPGLNLRVQPVSAETHKGKHTTTTAQWIPLSFGGFVVDTPGIRQFQLWDVVPQELANYFPEFRPYVDSCRYPDCSHRHEDFCAVKDAVADGRIDLRRYESYCHIYEGD